MHKGRAAPAECTTFHAMREIGVVEPDGHNLIVTSPKGLHGWKHRFAVNCVHSLGSLGLHGVPNRKHTFAILKLHVLRQAEEIQHCRLLMWQVQRGDPGDSADFCKTIVPTLQTYG
jgi:hypothetical protein